MTQIKILWKNKTWEQLTINETHEIFALRSRVFVVEQNCVYQDIDDKDPKAVHVYGVYKNNIIAYTRLFNEGTYFKEASFGRAVVEKKHRGKGLGDQLMKETLVVMKSNWPNKKIKISAQAHLLGFYQKHGFTPKGKEYLEDGIPHISMETF